jgi:hypothetical protein
MRHTGYKTYIMYMCTVLLNMWNSFIQPVVTKGLMVCIMPSLTGNDQLHVNFCMFITVMPACHSPTHRLDFNMTWNNSVSHWLCSGCIIPGMCTNSLFNKHVTDWLSGPHPALFLHRHSSQGITLTISHHVVPRIRIYGAWLPPVKTNVWLQILPILWNNYMLWQSYLQYSAV